MPIPNIRTHGPAASSVLLVEGDSANVSFNNVEAALAEPDTQVRLFGKPQVKGHRRMGVALARGETIEDALDKAQRASAAIVATLQ